MPELIEGYYIPVRSRMQAAKSENPEKSSHLAAMNWGKHHFRATKSCTDANGSFLVRLSPK